MLQGLQMLLAAATLQSLQTALAQPVQPALQRLQVLQALRPCPPPRLPLRRTVLSAQPKAMEVEEAPPTFFF